MNESMHGADLADYELRVRDALADLPADEVEESIQDLRAHLADVNAESPDGLDEQALVDRLGPPERYAAELRAAAGFDPPREPPKRSLRQRMTAEYQRWREFPWPTWVRDGVPYAQVGWWLVRGWLLGYVLSLGLTDGRLSGPVPELVSDDGWLALAVILGSIVGSTAVGHVLRNRRHPRWTLVMVPVNLVTLVGLGVLAFGGGPDPSGYVDPSAVASDDALIGPNGSSIHNIYPFDREGRPIPEVYLFDQDGNPINLYRDMCDPPLDYPMDNQFPRPRVIDGYDEVLQQSTACREDSSVPFTVVIRPLPTPTPPTPPPTGVPKPTPTPSVGR